MHNRGFIHLGFHELVTPVLIFFLLFSSQVEAKPITIGFANASGSAENTWRLFLVANYNAEIEAQGKKIGKSYYFDADNKVYTQKEHLDKLIASKVDVIIISAVHKSALNDKIEEAVGAGIPVVAFDRIVTSQKAILLNPSNYTLGKVQAKWLAKKLNYQGNIVMFAGIKGVAAAEDRLQGARDVFRQHPKIRVLAAAFTNWRIEDARKEMQKLIKQFPKIDGIWAGSGTASWPALEVLSSAKRKLVPSTGDQLNGYAKYLVKHNLDGFIYPFPSSLSRQAVRIAIRAANGETFKSQIDPPIETYGPKRIKELVRRNKPDFWWIGDDLMPQKFLPKI